MTARGPRMKIACPDPPGALELGHGPVLGRALAEVHRPPASRNFVVWFHRGDIDDHQGSSHERARTPLDGLRHRSRPDPPLTRSRPKSPSSRSLHRDLRGRPFDELFRHLRRVRLQWFAVPAAYRGRLTNVGSTRPVNARATACVLPTVGSRHPPHLPTGAPSAVR